MLIEIKFLNFVF